MDTTKNVTKAVNGRIIIKATSAWVGIRAGGLISDKIICEELKIDLFNVIIGSILIYGMHIVKHTGNAIQNYNPATRDIFAMLLKDSATKITIS